MAKDKNIKTNTNAAGETTKTNTKTNATEETNTTNTNKAEENKKTIAAAVKCLLNVRKEPNLDAEVVSVLNADEKIQITKHDKDWAYVVSLSGYCLLKFLDIKE